MGWPCFRTIFLIFLNTSKGVVPWLPTFMLKTNGYEHRTAPQSFAPVPESHYDIVEDLARRRELLCVPV